MRALWEVHNFCQDTTSFLSINRPMTLLATRLSFRSRCIFFPQRRFISGPAFLLSMVCKLKHSCLIGPVQVSGRSKGRSRLGRRCSENAGKKVDAKERKGCKSAQRERQQWRCRQRQPPKTQPCARKDRIKPTTDTSRKGGGRRAAFDGRLMSRA